MGACFQEYPHPRANEEGSTLASHDRFKGAPCEIADQVGFEDMNYFSQRFKQVVGVTPRQYKKGEHE